MKIFWVMWREWTTVEILSFSNFNGLFFSHNPILPKDGRFVLSLKQNYTVYITHLAISKQCTTMLATIT